MNATLRPRIFREVNERIAQITGTWQWEEKQCFLCECAADGCTEPIWLTRAEYEAIRAERTHFLAAAGHERAEEERVVERNDGYVVVEMSRTPASAAGTAARRPRR